MKYFSIHTNSFIQINHSIEKMCIRNSDERLETLKSEVEEYKEYQMLDKKRRCIEHIIYGREKKDKSDKLKKLDEDQNRYKLKLTELNNKLETIQKNIKESSKDLKQISKEIEKSVELIKLLK